MFTVYLYINQDWLTWSKSKEHMEIVPLGTYSCNIHDMSILVVISDRKMELKLFMTKSKDGGLMWCGTSGKVCLGYSWYCKKKHHKKLLFSRFLFFYSYITKMLAIRKPLMATNVR